jgi:hypothetical protein
MIHWKIILLLIIIKILSFGFAHYYTSHSINLIESKISSISQPKIIENPENIYFKSNEFVESEQSEKTKICISPKNQEFMFEWVRYTMVMIDFSRNIIRSKETDQLYLSLENSKDNLIKLFDEIHTNSSEQEKFKQIMNNQIYYKINLCLGVKTNDSIKIKEYSDKLSENNKQLEKLFIVIRKNKQEKTYESKLKNSIDSHTNLYIKSLGFMKKATDSELTRELVLGSIETVKLMLMG